MNTQLTIRIAKELSTKDLIKFAQDAHKGLAVQPSNLKWKRNYMVAMDVLMERFAKLIKSNVAQCKNYALSNAVVAVSFDDLNQCAHLGFIEAVHTYDASDYTFDEDDGDTLATYAGISIKREVLDFVQRHKSTVSDSRTRTKQLAARHIRQNSTTPTEILSKTLVDDFKFRNMRYARQFVVQELNKGTQYTSLNADNESYGDQRDENVVTNWLCDENAIPTERDVMAKNDYTKIKAIWKNAIAELPLVQRVCYLMSKGLTVEMTPADQKFKLREICDFLADNGITLRGDKPMSSENVRLYIKAAEKMIQSKMQKKSIPEEYFA